MGSEELKGTLDTSNAAQRIFMELLSAVEGIVEPTAKTEEVAPDVAYMRALIVNVCFIGPAGAPRGGWTLIDAGLPGSANIIVDGAKKRFSPTTKPAAIVLTHGHFDHVGALDILEGLWDVPIYAHEAELPFLTGKMNYPTPDPSVDAGIMARMSPLYPEEAINLGDRVHPLPADGSIPTMPDWRWIHTPGHTPGHIILFRESDRVMIIGDAFTTVDQESAEAFIPMLRKKVHGPPKYFTIDWNQAWESVKTIELLKPSIVIPSHGQPMSGMQLQRELYRLAHDFDKTAIPERGRYVPKSHI